MDKPAVPFWEATYQNLETTAFSPSPNASIQEFEHLFDKAWNILEAGCGEGQNALYLAGHGYANVDAFDISPHAIRKVNALCKARQVRPNAFVDDLTTFRFDKQYGLVLCFGTLHFVTSEGWHAFLRRAQENTLPGGIHIIQIFTDQVRASDDIASFAIGLAKDGELRDLYADWEILKFQSYIFEDEHPGVPKHLHASNKIIARKR